MTSNLDAFCQATYQQLESNRFPLPEKFQQMLPYMKQQNWLYNYRLNKGMERSFTGLVRRAAYFSESAMAYKIFNEHYKHLPTVTGFFSGVQTFCRMTV